MIRRSLCTSIAAALLSLAAADAALAGQASPSGLRDDGTYDQFIVHFAPGSIEHGNPVARQRALDAAGRANGVAVSQLRRMAIGADVVRTNRRLPRGAALALMQRLAKNPNVAFVEVDAVLMPLWEPNENYYDDYQWNFKESTGGINLPAAWNRGRGNGVVVAVVDTGVTSHSDLQGQVLAGYDFITDPARATDGDGRDANAADTGDWVAAGQCPPYYNNAYDGSSWHGTRVAGIIAAATNNNYGMAGVAPEAKILPVRAIGKCGGVTSDVSDAIMWAAGVTAPTLPSNPTPAEVINLSLGSDGGCPAAGARQLAINAAVARGVVVVAAAGNSNVDVANSNTASCHNVIAVAATTRAGGKAGFSNYGTLIDVAAPGGTGTGGGNDNVFMLSNLGAQTPGNEGFTWSWGTSFSAPHVAGTVALMQAYHARTPAEVELALKSSARAFPAACSGCGAGIVNADAALTAASGMATLPTVGVADVSVAEGDSGTRTANFLLTLSKPAPQAIRFYASTPAYQGTASAGSDYVELANAPYTIPAGQTSLVVPVTVVGDFANEGDESFNLVLSQPDGGNAGDLSATATIVDEDSTPPTLSIGDADAFEGNPGSPEQMYFRVTLSKPAPAPVTFSVTNTPISAFPGQDFAGVFPNYTIDAGTTEVMVGVDLLGDLILEGDETFSIDVVSVAGATLVDGKGIGTIYNDDTQVALSIGNAAAIVEGDAGSKFASFPVTVSPSPVEPVSFTVSTANGSASAGSDYTALANAIYTIDPGMFGTTVQVPVLGDTAVETDETFHLDVNSAAGAVVENGRGTATITNNDVPGLSISDASVPEGDSGVASAVFTVTLSAPSPVDVKYNVWTGSGGSAVANLDYAAVASSQHTIPAGQTSKTHAVVINSETDVELNEFFNLMVTAPIGATLTDGVGLGTITNDDAIKLNVGDVTIAEGNSGTKQAIFTASLTSAAAVPVTYTLTTGGGTGVASTACGTGIDYVAKTANESIPAGTLSKAFAVTLCGDTTAEANEGFQVTATNVAGAQAGDLVGQGVIANDDGPTIFINNVNIAEGHSGTKVAEFTVTLAGTATSDVTFNAASAGGTALAVGPNADYVQMLSTPFVIPLGSTTVTIPVTIKGDATIESSETFYINLSTVVGATVLDGQGLGTIVTDEWPSLAIADATLTEGNSGTKAMSFTVTLSQAVNGPVSYTLTANDQTAVGGSDFVAVPATAQTIPAGQTTRAFLVTVNGDTAVEANETLVMTINGNVGATVADGAATGTITNDD